MSSERTVIHLPVTFVTPVGCTREHHARYLADETAMEMEKLGAADGDVIVGDATFDAITPAYRQPGQGVADTTAQILTAIGRLGHRLALSADDEIQELGRAVVDLAHGNAAITQVSERLPGWELHGLLDGITDTDRLTVRSNADAAGWIEPSEVKRTDDCPNCALERVHAEYVARETVHHTARGTFAADCGSPTGRWTTDPAEVTCPDCPSHAAAVTAAADPRTDSPAWGA
jgi:hypothetical protein